MTQRRLASRSFTQQCIEHWSHAAFASWLHLGCIYCLTGKCYAGILPPCNLPLRQMPIIPPHKQCSTLQGALLGHEKASAAHARLISPLSNMASDGPTLSNATVTVQPLQ